MTELEHAIKHIKTRADAWAVKEVTEALQSISERLDKALSQEPTEDKCRYCKHTYEATLKQFDLYDEVFKEQEPCDDAISRDAVYSILKEYHIDEEEIESAMDDCQNLTVNGIASDVSLLPSVTQKSGKWIEHHEIETSTPEYLMFYECSECGNKQCFFKSDIHKKHFCNNCGAKMESGDKE